MVKITWRKGGAQEWRDSQRMRRVKREWWLRKTPDDSLCPLCTDCSVINPAAELLHLWLKMRIFLPFSSPLTFSDVGEMKWANSFKVRYKGSWIQTEPPQKKPSSLFQAHFLYPSFCFLPHQNQSSHYTSHHLVNFFFVLKCWLWALKISPSHLTVFLLQAEIIGMWLIKVGGGWQDGMTVNQPSQGLWHLCSLAMF